MTNITICKTKNIYTEFTINGHSGYSDEGNDIVCAGISVLAINFINSIEKLSKDEFDLFSNDNDGFMDFKFKNMPNKESQLLFNSLVLGFDNLSEQYSEFITLDFKEV